MSALDQAFIKAYAKEPAFAKTKAPARRAILARRTPALAPALAPIGETDPYLAGVWYRLDAQADETAPQVDEDLSIAETASVPSPRVRGAARRPHIRFRTEAPAVAEAQPNLPPPAEKPPAARTPGSEKPQRPVAKSPVENTPQVAPAYVGNALSGIPKAAENVIHSSRRPGRGLPRFKKRDSIAAPPAAEGRSANESSIEPGRQQVSVSPDSFSAVYAVGYEDGWESHLAFNPPLPPALAEFDLTAEPVAHGAAETAANDLQPHTELRVDAPEATIARPHFPLPIPEAEAPQSPAALQVEPQLQVDAAAEVEEETPDFTPVDEAEAPSVEQTSQEVENETETEAETQSAADDSQAVAPTDFEPAWEVERFSWPTTCDELLAAALDDWGFAVRQLLAGAKQGCKTLAVVGLRRGEGRSTLALCLARLAAQTGAKIALVDADFENPQLAETLGVGTQCDWRTAFAEGLPLAESSIVCLADQLTLLPIQTAVPFSQAPLCDAAAVELIKTAAEVYDLVLVDAGPIAGPEFAASWGGKSGPIDGVLLVRDLRRTDAEETAATVMQLRQAGVSRVVVLENFAGT